MAPHSCWSIPALCWHSAHNGTVEFSNLHAHERPALPEVHVLWCGRCLSSYVTPNPSSMPVSSQCCQEQEHDKHVEMRPSVPNSGGRRPRARWTQCASAPLEFPPPFHSAVPKPRALPPQLGPPRPPAAPSSEPAPREKMQDVSTSATEPQLKALPTAEQAGLAASLTTAPPAVAPTTRPPEPESLRMGPHAKFRGATRPSLPRPGDGHATAAVTCSSRLALLYRWCPAYSGHKGFESELWREGCGLHN